MTITLPEKTSTEKPIEVQILERAALIIEEHGHCCSALFATDEYAWEQVHKWRVDDPRLSYCEIGAIWRAGFEHGLLPGRWQEVYDLGWEKYGVDRDGDGYNIIAEVAGITEPWKVEEIHVFNDQECDAKKSAAHLRELAREWQSTRS